MQDRIEELEIRVSFQEDAIASLGAQLHEAYLEIARMRADIVSLRGTLDGMRTSQGDEAPEPPPPHY